MADPIVTPPKATNAAFDRADWDAGTTPRGVKKALNDFVTAMVAVGLPVRKGGADGRNLALMTPAYERAVMDMLVLVSHAPEWIAAKAMMVEEGHRSICSVDERCHFESDWRNFVALVERHLAAAESGLRDD